MEVKLYNYTLNRKIGEGNFATTYLGFDKERNPVAIKAINIENALDEDVTEDDINNEINIVLKLSRYPDCNTYIARCYDSFRGELNGDEYIFIVSEYIDGKTLRNYVSQYGGNIDTNTMWNIIYQLISGIFYIHIRDIAHRDINKDNVMITNSGHIKYIDFGLSCMGACEEEPSVILFAQQPPEKFLVNRPDIMFNSPESLEEAKQYDIWAVGLLIFELIYGEDAVPIQIMNADGDLLPRQTIVNNINNKFIANYKDQNIATLVNNLLATNPYERFTAIDALSFVIKNRP